MPWKECFVMDQRKEFVLESFKDDVNFTKLCAKYCISTKTGYKWKERFLQSGFQGLEDLSKRPNISPQRLSEDAVLEIIRIRNKKKHWGSRKIKAIYSNLHPERISPSCRTIERILHKAGLIITKKKKRTESGIRITNKVKAAHPNHIWTVDFKGWWYSPENEKINPLTVRDDFSKYILLIKALNKGDIRSAKNEFEVLFKLYGLPEIIRSDNGPPFASMSSNLGLTKLSVWWLSLGIKLDRIDPGSPYQNGGHERMHLDMKRELEGQIEGDIRYHQNVFDAWRKEFNESRPHEALEMKTPNEIYHKSEIEYDPDISEFDYPKGIKSRNVNNRGYVNYMCKRYFIGNPFDGYNIGIECGKDGRLNAWFGNNLLGYFDKETLLLIPEKNDIFKERKKRKVLPMS